jgi:hypothetical protein
MREALIETERKKRLGPFSSVVSVFALHPLSKYCFFTELHGTSRHTTLTTHEEKVRMRCIRCIRCIRCVCRRGKRMISEKTHALCFFNNDAQNEYVFISEECLLCV